MACVGISVASWGSMKGSVRGALGLQEWGCGSGAPRCPPSCAGPDSVHSPALKHLHLLSKLLLCLGKLSAESQHVRGAGTPHGVHRSCPLAAEARLCSGLVSRTLTPRRPCPLFCFVGCCPHRNRGEDLVPTLGLARGGGGAASTHGAGVLPHPLRALWGQVRLVHVFKKHKVSLPPGCVLACLLQAFPSPALLCTQEAACMGGSQQERVRRLPWGRCECG